MNIQVLGFKNSKAISVVQFRADEQDTFDYKSASFAIREKLIEVKEISDSGSVNDLFVINYSDYYVFFMDGDILTGAKQNRVLNTSVLLKPNSKTLLPVSCVEAGRWRYSSSMFSMEDNYAAPAMLRKCKSIQVNENLKNRKQHYADQSEVWKNVANLDNLHESKSHTSNLSDVYYSKERDFKTFTEDFEVDKSANGIAVFVNDRLSGIDVFNRKDIYAEYFTKILNGLAMESGFSRIKKECIEEERARQSVVDFMGGYETIVKKEYHAVGAGTEKRFESMNLTGFELSYEEHLIHVGVNVVE